MTADGVSVHTADDVGTWLQSGQRSVFIRDVLDGSNSDTMGVGFARYGPEASNEWVVTYDKVLIVTSGAFTVTAAGVRRTARAGEFIFLRKGTRLVYAAGMDGAELVYVTYPHPSQTELRAAHPDLVATFQPAEAVPPRFADGPSTGNVAILERIYGPLERGESQDFGPFFAALADDVVFELPVMELHGKQAVIGYFTHGSELMDFNPFERPLEYLTAGNRVVQLGYETFRVKETGAIHRAEWAWVFDFRDGRITRIVAIQDLGPIRDVITEIASRAQP
jgi:ketosteroid isomerase-like protein/quercetin dioxygenase-like cupin family protein